VGQILVGLAIVLAVSVRRLDGLQPVATCAALTAAVAASFCVTYWGNWISLL
jgi:hypothetical protein